MKKEIECQGKLEIATSFETKGFITFDKTGFFYKIFEYVRKSKEYSQKEYEQITKFILELSFLKEKSILYINKKNREQKQIKYIDSTNKNKL